MPLVVQRTELAHAMAEASVAVASRSEDLWVAAWLTAAAFARIGVVVGTPVTSEHVSSESALLAESCIRELDIHWSRCIPLAVRVVQAV